MLDVKEIIGNYEIFVDDVLQTIEDDGFDINDFSQIDHLCYRTSSTENYKQLKAELESVANLLGETMVNGRPIATYRLHVPVYYDIWRIDCIELPAPKPGKPFDEGLEHIELVLFDDIPTFLQKYTGKPFDLRASNRGINPEIGLQYDGFSVKFHLLSLSTVLYLEQKLGITEVND